MEQIDWSVYLKKIKKSGKKYIEFINNDWLLQNDFNKNWFFQL
jgi:hypothetical protein